MAQNKLFAHYVMTVIQERERLLDLAFKGCLYQNDNTDSGE